MQDAPFGHTAPRACFSHSSAEDPTSKQESYQLPSKKDKKSIKERSFFLVFESVEQYDL